MNNARSKASNNRYGQAEALDYAFNQYAGAFKTIPTSGHLKPLGPAGTAEIRVEAGSLIALYNNSATTAFVAVGDPGLAAPTGGADGICLRPNDYTVISVAQFNAIRANAATVFAYLVVDDLQYSSKAGIV